ncbi:MAG TPA: VWA domain-containing protein [Thermoguttaceae bacterium]|nr:VWA domain-containing protein [Thermoguttaceae bacterium]
MQALLAQLEMARPAWLAALLLVPLVVYGSRRSLTGFSRTRQAASLACRVLVVVAVVLGLCEIRVRRHTADKFLLVAVDESASIADESREAADAFVDAVVLAAGRGRVAVVPFARSALTAEERASVADSPWNTEATNLAAAIELAAVLARGGYVPQVVLLSDGLETEGNALRAARASGVPISTVPLKSRAEPEVYVSAVRTPPDAREGEPFYVDVVLHSSHDDEGTVELFRRDRLVEEKRTSVVAGESRVRFVQSIAGERFVRFTARIEGFRDTLSQNNSASAVVFTTARPRVLLVESEPRLAGHLAAALSGEGIDVEVRRPDEMPDALADWRDYELVVLSNVPAASLAPSKLELMRAYVGDFGGGLIAVGGDQAFTPGGYRNTTLEEILPVWCEFEKTDERPGLAMVLVLDRSGSMEEGGAIELAKEATRRAVGLLEPRDQVGVIAFQDFAEWISAIHPCSDKEHVLAAIDTITAGGGTSMYPAVERAYLALREATAELKHVIVLTDGVSHPGDFDGLVGKMAESGITVSTVAVGQETVRPLLEDMARIGQGHSYYCDTAEAVPEIFALETKIASKMGIHERPFRAQVQGSLEALGGLDLGAAPLLLGYVETRPKPASQTVMTSERGHPLLTWWRYGRGTSVAFTSDVQSRWAELWLRWPGFSRFWAQLVRHAIRKDQAEDFALRVDHANGRGRVTLEAVDTEGRYVNQAEVSLTLIGPDAPAGPDRTGRPLAVEQVAPGRYAADFPTPKPGTYFLELSVEHRGRLVYARRRGLVVGYPDEYRTRPADRGLLRAIADATGGSYDASPAQVVAPSPTTVPRTALLWPCFLASAAVMFVIDVAARRLPRRRSTRP